MNNHRQANFEYLYVPGVPALLQLILLIINFSDVKKITLFLPSRRHLQCEPAIIDAKDFSPQLRKRLFWGNIPGLYTVPNNNQIEGEMTLNMALIPNSGRQAALNKVRTLTTNTNSLLQGRTENCNSRKDIMSLFPVHWDSKLQSEFRERDEGTSSTSRKNKRKKKAHHSPEKSDHSSVISSSSSSHILTGYLFSFCWTGRTG